MAVTNPEAEAQERASQNTAVTGVDIVEKDNANWDIMINSEMTSSAEVGVTLSYMANA